MAKALLHIGLFFANCSNFIPFSQVKILESSYDVVVDALFGFGFRPPLKPDFAEVVQRIASLQIPLVCIDVPSGELPLCLADLASHESSVWPQIPHSR